MKCMESLRYLSILINVFTLILCTNTAHARDDVIPGSRYSSARALGMGDAYLPLADDGASALFYQPAAIGKLSGLNLEIFNLAFQANQNFLAMKGGLTDPIKATSLSNYVEPLQSNSGATPGLGFAFAPTVSMRGFAAGVLIEEKVKARAEGASDIYYNSKYKLIPAVGFGLPLAHGIVRFGYVAQYVQKAEGEKVAQTNSALGYTQGIKQGTALTHQFGFALNFPYQYLPTFDLVLRNVGRANYTDSKLYSFAQNPSGVPEPEQMTLDLATSLSPKISGQTKVNFVFEVKDLTNRSQAAYPLHVAIGTELQIQNRLFLRGGYGNGSPSFGFGLKSEKSELSLSYYQEALENTFGGEKDRRFIFQLRFGAF